MSSESSVGKSAEFGAMRADLGMITYAPFPFICITHLDLPKPSQTTFLVFADPDPDGNRCSLSTPHRGLLQISFTKPHMIQNSPLENETMHLMSHTLTTDCRIATQLQRPCINAPTPPTTLTIPSSHFRPHQRLFSCFFFSLSLVNASLNTVHQTCNAPQQSNN
ncbi:hypothetical protein P3342_009413 [Pyrenophora teres f. teres]|nr:hypothetical protein P3342_009413 [Pyrenophora teres f. teres]